MSKKNDKSIRSKSLQSHPSDNMTHSDSSEIRDIEEDQSIPDAFEYDQKKSAQIEEDAEEEYIKDVVMDHIVKYIKTDDLIKKKEDEHRTFMKSIKETRNKLEQFIIGYLEKIDQEFVQIGRQHKLTKTTKQHKSPIKPDNIKEVLKTEFKEKGIVQNDQMIDKMVEEFIIKIEEKREIKTKKSLSRSNPEKESLKKQNKLIKNARSKNNIKD